MHFQIACRALHQLILWCRHSAPCGLALPAPCLSSRSNWAAGALGSPGFVAPEIVMDAAHAPSMDVFSLGVVLFIMLVGRKPFNIADSESLAYVHLELDTAPGLRDARCGAAAGDCPDP